MSDSSKLDHPLRQVRQALNPKYKVTQQVLANMVGCTRQTINRIESEKLSLSEDLAERVDAAIGSQLLSWVKNGAKVECYQVDEKELNERFDSIRDHEARGIWQANFVYNVNLIHHLSSILGERLIAKDVQPALPVAARELLNTIDSLGDKLRPYFDVDERKRSLLARAFLSNLSVENLFSDESAALMELFVAARESKKFAAVQWSYFQWLDRTVKEFELPLDSIVSRVDGDELDAHSALKDLLQKKITNYNRFAHGVTEQDLLHDQESQGKVERMTPGKFESEFNESEDTIVYHDDLDFDKVLNHLKAGGEIVTVTTAEETKNLSREELHQLMVDRGVIKPRSSSDSE